MNFKTVFARGQRGLNKGLPMFSKGAFALKSLSNALHGLLKARIYAVGAAPKVGKTTLVDVAFVISPCLYVLEHNKKIEEKIRQTPESEIDTLAQLESEKLYLEIIYYSFEIDRVTKEFDFITHFLSTDFGITTVNLPQGHTFEGEKVLPLSASYLKGELMYDDTEEIIRVPEELIEKIKVIYKNRIVPILGEYDEKGNKLSKGIVYFKSAKDNPTGIRNALIEYAKTRGEILYEHFKVGEQTFKRVVGYRPNNTKLLTLIIADHVRKLSPERGFKTKETVDKYSDYSVEFRDLYGFSFVHICHINRSISDVGRRALDDDKIYPTSDDFKDTGNLAEDANYVLTMFDPTDDKYNLSKHFGRIIRRNNKSLLYPNMRTIHLVASRNTVAPQHFIVGMNGALKTFDKLNFN